MTISAYSSAIVDAMLGWLKGFANWVLRLFNLAGSAETSPLLWLSENWLKLLVILMIVGVAGDLLVWFFRWRPHWVWLRRERVIVDDERFFNDADIREKYDMDDDVFLEKNWEEHDYVVSSALVNRGRRNPKDAEKRSDRESAPFAGDAQHGSVDSMDADAPAKTRPREEAARLFSEQDFFGLDGSRPGVTDLYEDEVFNVNSLPKAVEYHPEDQDEGAEG